MRREIEGGKAKAAFEFMDKLEEGAEIYADMRAPDSSTWQNKTQLRDLKAYGVSSHFPLTLAAYRKWNGTDDFAKLLKLCAALSFRRTIIGGPQMNWSGFTRKLPPMFIVEMHLSPMCAHA